MTPNNDQLMSLLRTVLQMIGTAVVAHGFLGINGAIWEQISGAILMLAPTIWSMYARSDTSNLARVAAMPGPAKQAAFAGIPDSAKIAAVDALPGVAAVVVKTTAVNGTLAAANSTDTPKVIMTTPAVSAAIGMPATTTYGTLT